ncbi:MAG: hypothetical protein Q9182_002173 [Xanthomendoza sp. 2 TL-2023]
MTRGNMTPTAIHGLSAFTAHLTELKAQTKHSSITPISPTHSTTGCVGPAFPLSVRRKAFGTAGEEKRANFHVVPSSTARLDLLVADHRKMCDYHPKGTIADGEDVARAAEQHMPTRWKSRMAMALMVPPKLRIDQDGVAGNIGGREASPDAAAAPPSPPQFNLGPEEQACWPEAPEESPSSTPSRHPSSPCSPYRQSSRSRQQTYAGHVDLGGFAYHLRRQSRRLKHERERLDRIVSDLLRRAEELRLWETGLQEREAKLDSNMPD